MTQEGGATPEPSFVIALRGDYRTTVVGERNGLALVRVEIRPTQFEVPDDRAGCRPRAHHAGHRRARGRDVDRRGKAHDLYGSTSGATLARALQRELVSTFQVSVPESPSRGWTALELDPVGECEVAYALQRDGRYLRRKTRYVRVATAEGLLPADRVGVVPKPEVSLATYALDGNGRIRQLSSRNVTTASPSMSTASFATEVLARFDLRSEQFDPALASADPLAGLTKLGLTADPEAFQEAEQQALRQFVDGATAEQLIEQMAAEDTGRGTSRPAWRRSFAWTRARCASGRGGEAGVWRREPHGRAGRGRHARGATGADLPRGRCPSTPTRAAGGDRGATRRRRANGGDDGRRRAIDHRRGRRDQEELRVRARTLTGKLAATDEAQASAYVQKMMAQFEAARSDDARMRLLDALGNAGRPEGIESIAQGLTNPDSAVRDSAARALRKIDDPRADAMLSTCSCRRLGRMCERRRCSPRGFRRFSPLAAALGAVWNRSRRATSWAGGGLLATYLRRDEDLAVVPLLKWVAAQRPRQTVRQSAAHALSRAGTP